MKHIQVFNAKGETLLSRVKWCDTLLSRLRGLTLRPALAPEEGLILVETRPGIATTSIHMFFVSFPIAAIWLDDDRRVVHTAFAQPWRPYYAPPRPARYVLEGPPWLLDRVAVGDVLKFEE